MLSALVGYPHLGPATELDLTLPGAERIFRVVRGVSYRMLADGFGPDQIARMKQTVQDNMAYGRSVTGDDLNGDRDTDDVFDVGQLRRSCWDTDDPSSQPSSLGMGPANVLQERCNWGGDLDGDGFDDPIFLWDPATRELRVRLFVIGMTLDQIPLVRRVEAAQFLRNEQEL